MRIHYDTCSNIVSRVAFENFYRISSPPKSNGRPCADPDEQGQDPITRLYRPFGVLKAFRRFAAVLEPNAEVAVLQFDFIPPLPVSIPL